MEVASGILDWLVKGGPFALVGLLAIFAFIWRIKYIHSLFFPANDESNEARQLTDKARSKRLAQIAAGSWEDKYLGMLGRGLDVVAQRYAGDHLALIASTDNSGWTGRMFGLNPFTVESFEFCLRLALVYPLMSLILVWGLGGSSEFGGHSLFSDTTSVGQRLVAVLWMCLIAFAIWRFTIRVSWRPVLFLVIFIAAIFAGFVAGVGATGSVAVIAGLLAITIAISFTGAGTGAIAFAFAFSAGAIGGVVAFVVAIAVYIFSALSLYLIYESHVSNHTKVMYWTLYCIVYVCGAALLITWGLPQTERKDIFLIPIFLTLLPLLNGALDWISLGFTRGLLHAIHSRHHVGWVAAGWALLDIGLALLFLFIVTSVTALVLGGLNALACFLVLQPLLDLQQIFDGLSVDPLQLDYWWIHFMMLTTLIPTLVHFFSAAYALVLSVRPGYRQWIVNNIDVDKDARQAGFLYISFVPFIGVFGVLSMGWLLVIFLESYASGIGHWLLAWSRGVAGLLDHGISAVP